MKQFSGKVDNINLRIKEYDLTTIFSRFDALLDEYAQILREDPFMSIEVRRRILENRFLASIDKNAPYEAVLREFEKLELIGHTDLHNKGIFYLILFRFLKKHERNDLLRIRLASLRRELRNAILITREQLKTLEQIQE